MRRSNSYSLRNEIVLALIIKLVLIYCLWVAFFSHPISSTLSEEDVAKIIFSSPSQSHNLPEKVTIEKKEMINGR